MKPILIIILFNLFTLSYGQIIVGDATGVATDKTSVLLEFSKAESKGIIVPYVRTKPTAVEGTIILDAADPSAARVKYYNGVGSDGGWEDLSKQDGNITSELATQPAVSQVSEEVNAGVIIGSVANAPDGALVLNSTTKAMVLPIVSNYTDIVNPSAGMLVYIKNDVTGIKRLAVFNGSKWSFWKP